MPAKGMIVSSSHTRSDHYVDNAARVNSINISYFDFSSFFFLRHDQVADFLCSEDCEKGCNKKLEINLQNEHGDTPLHIASRWGFRKSIILILSSLYFSYYDVIFLKYSLVYFS